MVFLVVRRVVVVVVVVDVVVVEVVVGIQTRLPDGGTAGRGILLMLTVCRSPVGP